MLRWMICRAIAVIAVITVIAVDMESTQNKLEFNAGVPVQYISVGSSCGQAIHAFPRGR